MWQCSQQHDNREEAKFCAKCGERRIERIVCSVCDTILEPTDVFCIACGSKVRQERAPFAEAEPVAERIVVAAPPALPTPEATLPEVAAPVVAEVAAPIAAMTPVAASEPPVEPAAAAPEDFSFSFGGRTIGSKTPVKKVSTGKSPMTSAMMSFGLIALVLFLALYFLSR